MIWAYLGHWGYPHFRKPPNLETIPTSPCDLIKDGLDGHQKNMDCWLRWICKGVQKLKIELLCIYIYVYTYTYNYIRMTRWIAYIYNVCIYIYKLIIPEWGGLWLRPNTIDQVSGFGNTNKQRSCSGKLSRASWLTKPLFGNRPCYIWGSQKDRAGFFQGVVDDVSKTISRFPTFLSSILYWGSLCYMINPLQVQLFGRASPLLVFSKAILQNTNARESNCQLNQIAQAQLTGCLNLGVTPPPPQPSILIIVQSSSAILMLAKPPW